MGAENPVISCDLHILVYEAAESVSSQQPNRGTGGWGSAACGRVLMQRSVRTVAVVVLNVLAQHYIEVARPGDQEVVEAFPAQRADEPFRDRVGPGGLDWGAKEADVGAGEDGVEGGGELAVPVADQEPEP